MKQDKILEILKTTSKNLSTTSHDERRRKSMILLLTRSRTDHLHALPRKQTWAKDWFGRFIVIPQPPLFYSSPIEACHPVLQLLICSNGSGSVYSFYVEFWLSPNNVNMPQIPVKTGVKYSRSDSTYRFLRPLIFYLHCGMNTGSCQCGGKWKKLPEKEFYWCSINQLTWTTWCASDRWTKWLADL